MSFVNFKSWRWIIYSWSIGYWVCHILQPGQVPEPQQEVHLQAHTGQEDPRQAWGHGKPADQVQNDSKTF